MKRYLIDFQNGFYEEVEANSLEHAMKITYDKLAYTRNSVHVKNQEDGEDLAILPWYGVAASEEDVVTADYGKFGFYGEWVIC